MPEPARSGGPMGMGELYEHYKRLGRLAWIFTPNSHLTFWGAGYRNFKTSARPSHQGIGVDF
jgi:hypothetical protein